MSSFNYAEQISEGKTPQSEQAKETQVANSAGGFSFEVDAWKRLERFILLGSESGTYYIAERRLTKENAKHITKLIAQDGKRVVDTIVAISDAGRAPKNDPAIFALALAATSDNLTTKRYALSMLPKVCRIGTHLFQFAEAIDSLKGWGKSLSKAVSKWYIEKEADKLAFQLVKYQSRNGWSHRDIFRKTHLRKIEFASDAHQALARWVNDRENFEKERQVLRYQPNGDPVTRVFQSFQHKDLPAIIGAFEEAMMLKEPSEAGKLAALITKHRLPRECIPTEALQSAVVWEALLQDMPITAMIRNLAKMTSVGILGPLSGGENKVINMLGDKQILKGGRVHPLNVLVAEKIYGQGHGDKGSLSWTPGQRIVDALDAAFYDSFEVMVPTGKRHYLGIDISGSMDGPIAGMPLTCREAACAMAMVVARVEKQSVMFGFETRMRELKISPRMRLDEICRVANNWGGGGTDCAQPMLHALQLKIPVDAFVVITDSETWAGNVHPFAALKQYRHKTGIAAKEVVIGMTSSEFTIADPSDAGSLDVVGFDTSVPAVIADFLRE